jgi:YD repeat-containing protein
MLSVMREPAGPITGLGGDAGVAPVRYDALGRLEGFRPADSPGWSLAYDARGRPAVVTHPDGTEDRWVWAPDADPQDGISGLLATGSDGSVPWVFAEGGMAVRRNGMETESIVADGQGDPSILLDGTGELVHLSHSPSGVPNQDTAGIQGSGQRLQWFPGGPIQLGAVSLDPVSGQRVDGVLGWPWSVQGPRKANAAHPSDPAPWAPTGAWSNPLKLLETLGVLQPIEQGEWTRIGSVPMAFTGLPESVDGASPPLGPDREALPFGGEDPITDWLIHSLMPGGAPPGADSLAAAMIGAEVKLPWLPPGFEIPGLEYWRNQAAFSQE